MASTYFFWPTVLGLMERPRLVRTESPKTTDGLAALELAVDTGIAATCAEAVGVMDKTVAITVEYMNQRKQFGVFIASFQALRHRVADMKMQLELARSMSYYASLKLGAPADERRRAIARAKVQLGQSMRFVGQQAVQLHGGIGVTDEYIGSHYFKKLTQLEMTFGDTLHHLGEVSARIKGEYDLNITQSLILQPAAEINLAGQNVPERGIGRRLARAMADLPAPAAHRPRPGDAHPTAASR